jgi:hypothetical protein
MGISFDFTFKIDSESKPFHDYHPGWNQSLYYCNNINKKDWWSTTKNKTKQQQKKPSLSDNC